VGAAIEIQGVSKRFRLYHEKYSSLKERVLHAGHTPFEEYWAVNNIDAEIEAGKTVGILGRNGSGKSTLLKCIAGIIQPTSGQVVVRGQLAAMLELGAGFQPELSGRDNIYLNASLLGLSRKDIDRRFDAIVEFAELEQFIDNQVKYYSSGMYVRLGFAVAVNTDPDVLLVDEVLAVGDERFQQKCLSRVEEFQAEGRTIVVVSHSVEMMRQICEEILVIEEGRLVEKAPPGQAIRAFRDILIDVGVVPPDQITEHDGEPETPVVRHRAIKLGSVTKEYPGASEHAYVESGSPLTVRLAFDVHEEIQDASFGITLMTERSEIVFSEVRHAIYGGGVFEPGHGEIAFVFEKIPFLDSRFTVNIDVRDSKGQVIDALEPACDLEVMYPGQALGFVSLPYHFELTPPAPTGELALS
jgi:ABC-2 type transport system ATP-binding protein